MRHIKKRFLAVGLTFLLSSSPAFAATLVQSAGGAQHGGGSPATYAIGSSGASWTGTPATYNIGSGHLVVVVCANYNPDGHALTAPTDGTNTYTIAQANIAPGGSAVNFNAAYNQNTSTVTGGNVTCNTGTTGNHIAGMEVEFSGALTSGAFDSATLNEGSSTSASPSISTSTNTASANEVLIACAMQGNLSTSLSSEATSWTAIPNADTYATSGAVGLHCAYRNVTSTGTYSYAPTFANSTTYAMLIMSFKTTGAVTANRLLMRAIP